MIAAAYRYADGDGTIPDDLLLLSYCDRFGVEAVYGRTPGGQELRRMIAAENVVKSYEERQQSDNWAAWARDNPEKSEILNRAMRLAGATDNGE